MYRNYEAELDKAYGSLGSFQYFRLLKAEILDRRLEGERAKPLRILDVGAGDGTMLAMLNPAFERIGLEPDADMIAQRVEGARDLAFVSASGAALPLKSESLDLAFASCVFHHMPARDVSACLADCLRVLRPGGRLFVFEHNAWNLAIVAFLKLCVPIDRDAVFMTPHGLRRKVQAAGFEGCSWRYFCFLPGFLAPLRRIESWLGWLPLGGQYVFEARKPGGIP